jgi:hypothetical protein
MIGNLIKHVAAVHPTVNGSTYALAAGTTTVQSGFIDLQQLGGRSALFLLTLGAMLDTAVVAVTVQGSHNNSDWVSLSGATQTVTDASAASSNQVIGIDVSMSQYRYLRLNIARSVANSVLAALHVMVYDQREVPTTQATTAGQFAAAPVSVQSPAAA